MFVKQISIFLENKAGTLSELVEEFASERVNILALSIADTKDFGIVRVIVSSTNTEKMQGILRNSGYMAQVNEVICIRIPHKPGSFLAAFRKFEQKNNSLEYAYSLSGALEGDAVLILRLADMESAVQVLAKEGAQVVSQAEIDMF